MSALGRVVRAGVGRRRVQTVVMVLTTLMAVTASVLAAGLLVASRAPFERAFAEQRGAHLAGQFDGTKVTAARLAETADAPGVTASAGPFLTLSARARTITGSDFVPAGVDLPPLTVVGREEAGGPVDEIELTEGSWATRPGQIVLAADSVPLRPGDRLSFPDASGGPALTVVGIARSVTGTGDAWVTPAQAEALAGTPTGTGAQSGDSAGGGGGTASYEMLYRFRHAATDTEVAVGRAAIVAAVPDGAMSGARSYLTVRQEQTANAMAFVPFLAAFGVLGLSLSVLVIGIVVGGAVGAATRRIGVLKALGFTPAQVARAYAAQALVPAAVGCVLGVALGNALAVPVLAEAGEAFGASAGGFRCGWTSWCPAPRSSWSRQRPWCPRCVPGGCGRCGRSRSGAGPGTRGAHGLDAGGRRGGCGGSRPGCRCRGRSASGWRTPSPGRRGRRRWPRRSPSAPCPSPSPSGSP